MLDVLEASRQIEALLFMHSDGLKKSDFLIRGFGEEVFDQAIVLLLQTYGDTSGIELSHTGGLYVLSARPELIPTAVMTVTDIDRPPALPQPTLSALAMLLYHQPLTWSDLCYLLGGTIQPTTLQPLERCEWIRYGRSRQGYGYSKEIWTTGKCLQELGLSGLDALPSKQKLDDLFGEILVEPLDIQKLPPANFDGLDWGCQNVVKPIKFDALDEAVSKLNATTAVVERLLSR